MTTREEQGPLPAAMTPGTWLRWIVAGAVLGLGIGLLAAWTTDERWLVSAKVLLQIGPETAGSRPSMVGSPAPFLAGNPRREDVQTEVELLNNGNLLRRAFEQLLAKDPPAALGPEPSAASAFVRGIGESLGLLPPRTREERALDRWAGSLRVNVVPSSTVLLLECRSERPQAAERLLQTMLDLYLADHRAAFGAHGLSAILGDYVSAREQALVQAEQVLTERRCRHGVVDIAQQVQNLERRRSDATTQAQTVEGELAAARARTASLQRMLEQTPAERRVSAEERPNPTRDELDLRLATARQDLAVAKAQFTADSPQVRQATEVVELLQGLVTAALPQRAAGVVVGRDTVHDALRDLRLRAEADVQGLQAQLAVARAAVAEVGERLLALERGRAEIEKAEQDVAEARKDVVQAREGMRLAGIEEVLDANKVANVTVVTPPNHLPTPLRTFGLPARVAIVLGSLLFGAGLGLAIVLWRRAPAAAPTAAMTRPSVTAVRGESQRIG